MTESNAQLVLGLSVVSITNFLMDHYSISRKEAYKKFIDTDFFDLLHDFGTNLYLEPEGYQIEACLLELEQGKDAMYEYILKQ